MFIFSLFFIANFIKIVLSTTDNCRHPTNASEFCVKTDYDVNKLPPEKPLNVDMDLWIHVSCGIIKAVEGLGSRYPLHTS